jgi:hypothetical protein
LLGGAYCFSNDDPNISVPYIFIGIAVLLVAVLFSRVKLPEFVADGNDEEYDAARKVSGDRKIPPGTARSAAASQSLWRRPVFVFGLFALFCYEVAEIAINSFFINYATENHMAEWINTFIVDVFHTTLNYNFISSIVLSAGLFLFMCGRFAGSWIMRFVRAETILLCCAAATVLMTTLVVLDIHIVSFVASVLIFLFESIMFPTIFALSIKGLGPLTQKASAVLMMTPIGGAAGAVLMGMAADYRDMTFSFLVPLAAFVVIWAYATVVCRKKTKTKPVAPTVNIMSLEFFAQHFNFLVEDLQWGIAEVIKDGEIMYVNCAVLVKEKSLYIAISEGKIRPCVNCCIVSFNLIPCEVHEEDNKFIFASKGYRISIRRESIHEFYADRVYSSDTNTYLLGAFADYD